MRFFVNFTSSVVFVCLLSGCGTALVSTQWRNDAVLRFNTAISAGAEVYAPEETDNIRQTISLADRYHRHEMGEHADRLYQLSIQKSQLLYRNLVISKVARAAGMTVSDELNQQLEVIDIASAQSGHDVPLRAESSTSPGDLPGSTDPAVDTKIQPLPITEPRSRSLTRPPASQIVALVGKKSAPRSDPAKTVIYLTFDDGPSRLTLPIASFLRSEGIKATFFVLGSNIKGSEKAVSETIALGHQVGNHTVSHNLQKLRASFATESNEIQRAAAMIERLGGDGKMVRIPYGASGNSIVHNVVAEGAQIFKWDINSNDSTQRGVRDHLFIEKSVLNQLNKNTKKHVILLFHDGTGHNSTLSALRDLIPRLKQQGYSFGLLARSEKMARVTENRPSIQ